MHYEEVLLLRTPGTFSVPAKRTLTAGRFAHLAALPEHPIKLHYM
jgi:hypothetical protein